MSTKVRDQNPMTLSGAPLHIRNRLSDIEAYEIQCINLARELEMLRRRKRHIENHYIRDGVPGTNERTRQANLEETLAGNSDWQDLVKEEDSLSHHCDMMRASVADLKRCFQLELVLLGRPS